MTSLLDHARNFLGHKHAATAGVLALLIMLYLLLNAFWENGYENGYWQGVNEQFNDVHVSSCVLQKNSVTPTISGLNLNYSSNLSGDYNVGNEVG